MPTYDEKTLADLLDGKLPFEQVHAMLSAFKDADRFEKMLAIHQARVSWSDRILLPYGMHLYIVQKSDGSRVTKCECGHEFGDYRRNWKYEALVYVRDTEEKQYEIYPAMMHSDPDWMILREFYCPGCMTQLEVEAVPPGYPLIFDMQPDIDALYRDWLKKELYHST
jgi:acetone carboxylase, gamma subunit